MAMPSNNSSEVLSDGALVFDLLDGESVVLPTWAYILAKLTEALEPIIQSETSVNESLALIESKIDSWIQPEE
mgnify:CR=1 FL=1